MNNLNLKHLCVVAMLFMANMSCLAQEVSSVYIGGHIRRQRPATITKLQQSGFQTAILFNVHVDTDGTLITDGETICKDGVYVFDKTQPYYVKDINNLKAEGSGISRIEICIGGWGNDSYAHIKSLIQKEGTGENSILYRNFKALKDVLPIIDAVNNDQEQDYDANNTIAFHKMMYSLGYKTTIAPYTNKSFWQQVANGLKDYGLDRILIQCYDGGAGNNPSDWHLLSNVPLHAGLLNYGNDWNMDTNRRQFESWRDNCGVTGGFVWVYNDETWNLNDWAASINRIYGAKTVSDEETAVTLYSEENYNGFAVKLPVGTYLPGQLSLYGMPMREISSVRVKKGYKIKMFKNVRGSGSGVEYLSNTGVLGTMNNAVCSVVIEKLPKPALLGDFNGDGILSVADLTTIAAKILSGETPEVGNDGIIPGDANGDGTLSVADLTTIAAKILTGDVKAEDVYGEELNEVKDVVTLSSRLTLQLSTDKCAYQPGETVTFSCEGTMPENARVRYRHLFSNVVKDEPLTANTWTWQTPDEDNQGYLVEVYIKTDDTHEDIKGSIAVDVSSDWARFPRYGFVATFDDSKTDDVIASEIEWLNRCHINGVQFQDWHNKHHWPLGGTRNAPWDSYNDIANRTVKADVVKKYIDAQHGYGMKAMFYNLCYGALEDAADDGVSEEWYVFTDRNHTTKDKHDLPDTWKSDIYVLDPSNVEWQQYMAERNDEVYANFDFDGYQIDQLGSRGTRYSYKGTTVKMETGYASFINAMKEKHPEKRLVMNAVSGFGGKQIAETRNVDFLYNEVWGDQEKYDDLYKIIKTNNSYADGDLQTVFAAYMDYEKDNSTFNVAGVLLADAVMFALGGSHLELGDHMLCREYFPYSGLTMSTALKTNIERYYDFLVAYENLLRGKGTEESMYLQCLDGSFTVNAWPPVEGNVVSYGRNVGGKKVVSLINFGRANTLSWRDVKGNMPAPRSYTNVEMEMDCDQKITHLWAATPDVNGGAPQELAFTQQNGTVKFTLPNIKYWTMIVAE